MPDSLVEAHEALDLVVDRMFGISSTGATLGSRQGALFEAYARLDAGLLGASVGGTRRRKR